MSAASSRLPNSSASPSRRRQQARQHLHRRRLAAAVGADEAENFATLDREADVIDRREIAEPTRQVPRNDDRRAVEPRAAAES